MVIFFISYITYLLLDMWLFDILIKPKDALSLKDIKKKIRSEMKDGDSEEIFIKKLNEYPKQFTGDERLHLSREIYIDLKKRKFNFFEWLTSKVDTRYTGMYILNIAWLMFFVGLIGGVYSPIDKILFVLLFIIVDIRCYISQELRKVSIWNEEFMSKFGPK